MKVKMIPSLASFRSHESGIKRVIEAYYKYLPQFGIELVDSNPDIVATHAGNPDGINCDVAHLHGLYWTADYNAGNAEYATNSHIVSSLRNAKQITVPSNWVAETIRRDMRLNPHVIPHGIEWNEWKPQKPQGYVLWNKNRDKIDVTNTKDLDWLTKNNPTIRFVSTFGKSADNIVITGLLPHNKMKTAIEQCSIYLSDTKETFGIGILEAMSAGKPILGWANGGNLDLVQHGTNGYLAQPGNYEDLQHGLEFCFEYQKVLGENSREMVKLWTWENAIEKLVKVYELANQPEQPTSVSVVIPVYNKPVEMVRRAIESVLKQTLKPDEIIVINDGSDKFDYSFDYPIILINQPNQGVANARNNGVLHTNSKYICCLDSDDWIEPEFLATCIKALENDKTLSIAYTGIMQYNSDGSNHPSQWPGQWDYDKHLKGSNQIPTCCVYTREMFDRLGGYRQRYAPHGAGQEDAEFWLRAGAYGFKAAKVSDDPLFNYSFGTGLTATIREINYHSWHPWTKDNQHPFMSHAAPKRHSHPVRQYDEPEISVIIPVGPGHESKVIDALDSLEAQTFRNWEVVVVWDGPFADEILNTISKAYPYIYAEFCHKNGKAQGAGYARNRGIERAKSPLIFFLDADDTLYPQALEKMHSLWKRTGRIVYSDFVGKGYITPEYAERKKQRKQLLECNPDTMLAVWEYDYLDYDCDKAINSPNNKFYDWSTVSILLPKSWHNEIGGFDESMPTWEDWDYKLRLAKAGYCFKRLPEPLLTYNVVTGSRRLPSRDGDRQKVETMLKYLLEKYKDIPTMGCNCKEDQVIEVSQLSSEDFVSARYLGPHGNHHVFGTHLFDSKISDMPMQQYAGKWRMAYMHISHGKIVPVHRLDLQKMPDKWEPVQAMPVVEIKQKVKPTSKPQPIKPKPQPVKQKLVDSPASYQVEVKPQPVIAEIKVDDNSIDIYSIPGVTKKIGDAMAIAGLVTKEAILSADLTEIKGIGLAKQDIIKDYAKENL